MMDKANAALNSEKAQTEFLSELARVVSKYRTEIPLGPMLGALEIAKFRLHKEAMDAHDEEKGQP